MFHFLVAFFWRKGKGRSLSRGLATSVFLALRIDFLVAQIQVFVLFCMARNVKSAMQCARQITGC